MKLLRFFSIFLLILSTPLFAKPENEETINAIKTAIENPARPEEDRKRDDNRLPLDTLKFFGLKQDMTVIDLLPGGGYYTRILAPVLKNKGQLYLAIGTDHLKKELLKEAPYQQVKLLSEKTTIGRPEGAHYYQLGELDFANVKADMVTNFRAQHLYSPEDRKRLNKAVFAALKPGGIFAVIDHTARHGEPPNSENRRRLDPVLAILEIQAAGFKLVDMSNIHYRPSDDLTLEVGNEKVAGQTDRWTLKFIKPL